MFSLQRETRKIFKPHIFILLVLTTIITIVFPIVYGYGYYSNAPQTLPSVNYTTFEEATSEYIESLDTNLTKREKDVLIPYYERLLGKEYTIEPAKGWNYLESASAVMSRAYICYIIIVITTTYSTENDINLSNQIRSTKNYEKLRRIRYVSVLIFSYASYLFLKLSHLIFVLVNYSLKGSNNPIQDYFDNFSPFPWNRIDWYLSTILIDIIMILVVSTAIYLLSYYFKNSSSAIALAFGFLVILPFTNILSLNMWTYTVQPSNLLAHYGLFDTNNLIWFGDKPLFFSIFILSAHAMTAISLFIFTYFGKGGTSYVEA